MTTGMCSLVSSCITGQRRCLLGTWQVWLVAGWRCAAAAAAAVGARRRRGAATSWLLLVLLQMSLKAACARHSSRVRCC